MRTREEVIADYMAHLPQMHTTGFSISGAVLGHEGNKDLERVATQLADVTIAARGARKHRVET